MLSCDADCFINVVLALALAYFLFVLLLFWIEIHKPLHTIGNDPFCRNVWTSLLGLELNHM